jgi:glutamyl-tRNA reductase
LTLDIPCDKLILNDCREKSPRQTDFYRELKFLLIRMASLDYHLADLTMRERFSFTAPSAADEMVRIRALPGVTGAVLLATCNRTELFLSLSDESGPDPAALLAESAGYAPEACREYLVEASDLDAVRHLMEVACGLQSMILCEDQIITQVRAAAARARALHTSSPVLETMFRFAVTAAKKAKTAVQIKAVPRSSADRAVELLRQHFASLSGRRGLVIGNGEMGRLCAEKLAELGCDTAVTLRSYHRGQTIVPFGCRTVPYEARAQAMELVDFVVSATVSPHYTVSRDMVEKLTRRPEIFIDLALPRDIDPAVAACGVTCLNIDDMVTAAEQRLQSADGIARIEAIIDGQLEQFRQWQAIHLTTTEIDSIKEMIGERMPYALDMEELSGEELMQAAVDKTIDLLLFSAREQLTPDLIRTIEQNLKSKRGR